MGEDDGASPRELVVEGCRRDQPHLVEDVLHDMEGKKSQDEIAKFFNGVKDSMGNHCLHICANYGSYEVMDLLFDIRGFECDPLTRLDHDTPLHTAVRYSNENDSELGLAMVTMMCEAGCDPRVRNKGGVKPADLVLPQHKEVKTVLQRTEYIFQEGVDEEDAGGEESDGPSDSDNEVGNGPR